MTIFETIKFWWRVKKYNRRLLKQAKYGNKDPYETTKEDVDKWFESNPFELDRELLNTHHMESAPKSRTVHIFRNLS
jgi:hypothetical protein